MDSANYLNLLQHDELLAQIPLVPMEIQQQMLEEKPPIINKKNKVVNKEIERQRRQDMSDLYKSFFSLVPPEELKGKRSRSDQMNEITKYIQHQQKTLKELGAKRDKLKQSVNSTVNRNICSPNCVTLQSCVSGVEVVVRCGLKNNGLPCSKILALIEKEGLSVISFSSTITNDSTLYLIQAKIVDSSDIDLPGLQGKLIDLNHLYGHQ